MNTGLTASVNTEWLGVVTDFVIVGTGFVCGCCCCCCCFVCLFVCFVCVCVFVCLFGGGGHCYSEKWMIENVDGYSLDVLDY